MTRTVLQGLNGSNPLGFMASVGLLRLLDRELGRAARLGFVDDGTFHAWIECDPRVDVSELVANDAAAGAGDQPWRLEYTKMEKKGPRPVADLKAPPADFARFLVTAIGEWKAGSPERAEYAAAYATDVARDGKENTKPTAFHFTAANQQFLGTVEESRRGVTREWVERALHFPGQTAPGQNLRWDPDAERNRALMGVNPTDDGTVVNAPLEWLAFRGLPSFRCFPIGSRIVTCGVSGRRQNEFQFHWPVWSCAASYATVRSLLPLAAQWSEAFDDRRAMEDRHARGVFAVCTSGIRRTAQGFGNFGPAFVRV
jgi:hypothetical protein